MSFPSANAADAAHRCIAAALLFAAGVAEAQSNASPNISNDASSSASYSSSQSGLTQTELAEFVSARGPDAECFCVLSWRGRRRPIRKVAARSTEYLHSWTFEAGGGFNAPEQQLRSPGAGNSPWAAD